MKTQYIVIDEDGNRSFGGKDADELESFKSFRTAEARAKELASISPGRPILICEVVAETIADVKPTHTARKYPIEHYK